MPDEPKPSRKRRRLRRGDPDRPGALERGRMRRRMRRQSQVREALLLDLGALVYELHRQTRREPELLQAKAAELSAVDEEVRALSDTLDAQGTVFQLTAAGIAGTCSHCAAIVPADAHYCASCGASTQSALGSAVPDQSAMVNSAQPSGEPLPPDEAAPTELGTDERAALEAGGEPEPQHELEPEAAPAREQSQVWSPAQAIEGGPRKSPGRARSWLRRGRG